MTAPLEIELKLETDARGAAALKKHPLLKKKRSRRIEQASAYFDTSGGVLRQAGFSLRVRAADGGFVQTVKLGDGAGLFARPEWERPVAGPEPDLAALGETPAAALIGAEPLQQTSRTEGCRRIWQLDRGGNAIELVLDEARIAAGDAQEEFAEVEIELKAGEPAALFGIGRDLAESAPLRIGVLSKAERGRRLADGSAARPAKAEPVRLDPDMDVAEGFAAVVHSCLRQFRLNEGLVAGQRDAGALHQARVAIRRLRSAFSLFGRAIEEPRRDALKAELRWFAGELGEARNIDVLLRRIDGRTELLRPVLEEARAAAYDRAVIAIHSDRLRLMLFDIVAWTETGDWHHRRRARRRLGAFAAKALERRWDKVKDRAGVLRQGDAETRHRLRIEVKKLRYAAEFLAALETGDDVRRKDFVAALEALQEQLGELNDQETARHILKRLVKEGRGAPAEAAARLAGGKAAEEKTLRAAEKATDRLLAQGPYWR